MRTCCPGPEKIKALRMLDLQTKFGIDLVIWHSLNKFNIIISYILIALFCFTKEPSK